MKTVLATTALLCAACAGPGANPRTPSSTTPVREPVYAEIALFPGFPVRVATADFVLSARFMLDHALRFGADLGEDEAVLPIEVTIEPLAQDVELDFDTVCLVLSDGTTLRPVRASKLRVASEFTENALRSLEHVPGRVDGRSRYFFFALEPASAFHVRGSQITHRSHGVMRRLELADALVALELTSAGVKRFVRVGVSVEDPR
jgi:hypothetical protein